MAFLLLAETKPLTFSANISSRFPFPLRTNISFNNNKIFIPMKDDNLNIIKNTISWTSAGLNGTYSLKDNLIRVSAGFDYMTNGSDSNSVQIIGSKIGLDWDIIENLIFSIKGNIRMNRVLANKEDGIDNDEDGKIDNSGEIWSTSNSGLVFSINYRF